VCCVLGRLRFRMAVGRTTRFWQLFARGSVVFWVKSRDCYMWDAWFK